MAEKDQKLNAERSRLQGVLATLAQSESQKSEGDTETRGDDDDDDDSDENNDEDRSKIIHTMATKLLNFRIKLHLLNKDIYGYMLPPYEHKENLHAMQILFVNAKLEYFVNHPETLMTVSPHVTVIPSKKDKLDFDERVMADNPVQFPAVAALPVAALPVAALPAVEDAAQNVNLPEVQNPPQGQNAPAADQNANAAGQPLECIPTMEERLKKLEDHAGESKLCSHGTAVITQNFGQSQVRRGRGFGRLGDPRPPGQDLFVALVGDPVKSKILEKANKGCLFDPSAHINSQRPRPMRWVTRDLTPLEAMEGMSAPPCDFDFIDKIAQGAQSPNIADLPFRDPNNFLAGQLHLHARDWEELVARAPYDDAYEVLDWEHPRFGGPSGHSIDLMALDSNTQDGKDGKPLPHFTPYPMPGSAGVDIFAKDLSSPESDPLLRNLYVFPPIILIGPVIRLLQENNCSSTIVIPDVRPRRYWWPTLNHVARTSLRLASRGQLGAIRPPPLKKVTAANSISRGIYGLSGFKIPAPGYLIGLSTRSLPFSSLERQPRL
ncbi:hypothetical protein QZH41_000001 [Actinostola sp. cb2023]|nr:hypothetical protein QZH41_000001 [Actinostola sp. cb2023]